MYKINTVVSLQSAQMVMSDLLVVPLLMKGELNSATIMLGALCVMMAGVLQMPMLCAVNSATLTRVSVSYRGCALGFPSPSPPPPKKNN